MKTYSDARILREDIAKDEVPPKVVIEVSTELLAAVLGQRFTDSKGTTISMEQVDIGYDTYFERAIAQPVFVDVSDGQE